MATQGAAATGREPASYPALIQNLGRPASTASSCDDAAAPAAAAIPHKCAIETSEFGPLTIMSKCTSKSSGGGSDLSRPDVTSLSILRLGGSKTVNDEADDGELIEEEEIALFGDGAGIGDSSAKAAKDAARSTASSSSSSDDNEYSDKSASLLRLLPSLPGIRDRLMDAAATTSSSTGTTTSNASAGQLELFLSRSEAVVTELLSAIDQYRQRQARVAASAAAGRKRKRFGNGVPPLPLLQQRFHHHSRFRTTQDCCSSCPYWKLCPISLPSIRLMTWSELL